MVNWKLNRPPSHWGFSKIQKALQGQDRINQSYSAVKTLIDRVSANEGDTPVVFPSHSSALQESECQHQVRECKASSCPQLLTILLYHIKYQTRKSQHSLSSVISVTVCIHWRWWSVSQVKCLWGSEIKREIRIRCLYSIRYVENICVCVQLKCNVMVSVSQEI